MKPLLMILNWLEYGWDQIGCLLNNFGKKSGKIRYHLSRSCGNYKHDFAESSQRVTFARSQDSMLVSGLLLSVQVPITVVSICCSCFHLELAGIDRNPIKRNTTTSLTEENVGINQNRTVGTCSLGCPRLLRRGNELERGHGRLKERRVGRRKQRTGRRIKAGRWR